MRQRTLTTALVIASTLVVAGCGDVADRDFCSSYDDVVAAAEDVRDLDVEQASAEELRDQVETFQSELDQLQAVSEGRLDTAISTLRTAVNDFVNSAVDAGEEALETARPMLEETKTDIQEAWSVVELMAANECAEQ